jgi:hypothetical protein
VLVLLCGCTLPDGRVSAGISVYTLCAALSTAGGKALAAQNGPACLGLERNTVTLPALIANNLESFPLAATAASSALPGAAKVGAPRVAAWFAALRMSQSAFAIIVLLSFSKRKG